MAVIFVISYNVTLLDQKKSKPTSSNSDITTKKKWWEVYGEKKKEKVESPITINEETGEQEELPVPKGAIIRKKMT